MSYFSRERIVGEEKDLYRELRGDQGTGLGFRVS